MTVETFGDFELSWEWKVTPGANSGVKYNVSEALSVGQGGQLTPAAVAQGSIAPHHSALGFEYQMLDDDRHPDGQLATHRAGALYDLFAPNEQKQLRPVGQWNQSKVVLRGNHGEHWLNGEKIVEFELGTAHMDSALAASKRSEEHTSELQSPCNLVCRLLLEKKKKNKKTHVHTYRQ